MSASEITLPDMFVDMSDRELLEATYASQLRTEMIVTQFVETLGPMMQQLEPTVAAFAKGGIMGILKGGR